VLVISVGEFDLANLFRNYSNPDLRYPTYILGDQKIYFDQLIKAVQHLLTQQAVNVPADEPLPLSVRLALFFSLFDRVRYSIADVIEKDREEHSQPCFVRSVTY
jgi:hypothetical protein